MKTYNCNSLADFYKQVHRDFRHPFMFEEISPRGLKTKEMIGPQILITNPRNRLAYHEDRKFSNMYAFVESLLIFEKTKELKYFSQYNDNIHNFSDDGKTLYGSYGYRIAEYISEVIDKLQRDNNSRQIVLPILRIEDVVNVTKDVPCTLSLQLLVRNNKLNMIVNMRSNDIIWGVPYDIFVFTTIQEIVANTLGIELGWYLHRPASLHLYETHYDMFEKIGDKFKNIEITFPHRYEQWIELKDDYLENYSNKGATFYKNTYNIFVANKITEVI